MFTQLSFELEKVIIIEDGIGHKIALDHEVYILYAWLADNFHGNGATFA